MKPGEEALMVIGEGGGGHGGGEEGCVGEALVGSWRGRFCVGDAGTN